VSKPTILVSTWCDGLFAVTGDWCRQEIADLSVRGLAPDGRGGSLAIVGGNSLWRRAASGEWVTVTTSEFLLSCCMAVQDTIYVGTDDARMLRMSDGGAVLEPIDSFDNVAGRNAWFAGSAIIMGNVLDQRSAFAPSRPIRTPPCCLPTFTWGVFRVPRTAEETGSPRSISIAMFMRYVRTMQTRKS